MGISILCFNLCQINFIYFSYFIYLIVLSRYSKGRVLIFFFAISHCVFKRLVFCSEHFYSTLCVSIFTRSYSYRSSRFFSPWYNIPCSRVPELRNFCAVTQVLIKSHQNYLSDMLTLGMTRTGRAGRNADAYLR